MRKRETICLYTSSYPLELRTKFEGERNIETQERKNNSPYKCPCHSQKEVTEATKNMPCETGKKTKGNQKVKGKSKKGNKGTYLVKIKLNQTIHMEAHPTNPSESDHKPILTKPI
jgi:hypothetical protein